MSTSPVRVLAENDKLQLLHQSGEGPFCLVIFAPMFSRADGRTFWGAAPARKLKIEAFGLMPKSPNWYPAIETEEMIAHIKAHTDRPIMTYGASMGGYGALRYAAALGAHYTAAFSPQVSIEPEFIGKDDIRYNKFFSEDAHQSHHVTSAHLAPISAVFHDPKMHWDAAHIRRLDGSAGMLNIKLPFTGHPSITTAASSAVLGQVFKFITQADAPALHRLLLPRRRLMVEYYRELSFHASRKNHLKFALMVLDHGMSKFPDHPLLLHAYGRVHYENQQSEAASNAFSQAIMVEPKNLNHYNMLAKSLIQAQQYHETIQVLNDAPIDHICFSLRRSEAYQALGDYAQAIAELEAALVKSPGHRGFISKLQRLQDEQIDRETGSEITE